MKEAISTCDGCKFDANEALCAADDAHQRQTQAPSLKAAAPPPLPPTPSRKKKVPKEKSVLPKKKKPYGQALQVEKGAYQFMRPEVDLKVTDVSVWELKGGKFHKLQNTWIERHVRSKMRKRGFKV